jgi:apolipoprotein D and lipocalin family protein
MALGLLLAGCASPPRGNLAVPEPAKPVDLTSYLGTWYEIARYDQRFEKGCVDASALYTLRPDGKLGILNSCRLADGTIKSARARGKIVPGSGNAKLKVSFFGPFYFGNYWVLDHADDYSWSIVGDPSGRYLWLLARSPDAAPEPLYERAKQLGYDTSLLIPGRRRGADFGAASVRGLRRALADLKNADLACQRKILLERLLEGH